ncbi:MULTISPECIES: HEPN domain-containing protein [Paenibacillus]|uniref:HEPN domain-containing protein n=1 Tax=Paenibacillus TaxID=44249 RepID=UPI000B88B1BB|nr:HEPN domain-containing protein [Paenibacillus amylolyticus]
MEDNIELVILENVKLEKSMFILNKYFTLFQDGDKTILSRTKDEPTTYENHPTVFFDCLRLALPKVNLRVRKMSGFEESYLYTLNNSKNSFLINYYGSTAIDVPSVSDDVYVIGDTDIDSIKKVMYIIFEHSQIQHTAMSNSEWKTTEWSYAYNNYLSSCSTPYLEQAILSIITALEALLVNGSDQVSYRVSLNASLLTEEDETKRKQTFDLIKDLYNLRSKVVHGDISGFLKNIAKPDIYDRYFKLKEVLSKILVKTHKVPMKTLLSQIEGTIFKAPAIVLDDL